jgi:hypothetical protein
MQCQVHRGSAETFPADVWFSTYKENGAQKLAAIIADVTEERCDAIPSEQPSYGSSSRACLRVELRLGLR